MPEPNDRPQRLRVLCLVPTDVDGAACGGALDEPDLDIETHTDDRAFCAALESPADLLLVAEERLSGEATAAVERFLADQEEWSLVPLILLTKTKAWTGLRALSATTPYGGLLMVERPVHLAVLASTVGLALHGRRQQYRIRDLLAERAQRIRERDEFVALISHELRNPFAAISLCAELLSNSPPEDSSAVECRQMILRQTQEIERLLDDLLNVSRIARGKLELERKPADLVEILESARQQSLGALEKLSQHLTLSLPPGPIPLFADTTRLQQVFANLLNNASRYSGPGTAIALEASCRDDIAEVRVRDNGIGMGTDDLARIFEPFFQAGASDRTGGPSRAGLGLGLALAHSLLEMHGGTLEARSEGPGRGSEFIVRLPMSDTINEIPPSDRSRRPRAKSKSPQRLLLIDDNRQITYSLERLLTRRGYQVEVAHSGETGIQAAARNVPDVVVLDIGLPDLDGYEVARRLRELPALAGARLIALSGFGSEHDRQRSREAGIDEHLVKPVRLNDLEAAIGTR